MAASAPIRLSTAWVRSIETVYFIVFGLPFGEVSSGTIHAATMRDTK